MANLAVLGGVLFCFALFARRVQGTVITAPMVFVTAGLVAGWTGLLDFGSATHGEAAPEVADEAVLVVAELALVLLLFTDAAHSDVGALRGNPLPVRLLCIGLPLTILLGTVVAVALLADLEFWECAIVAAVLAPTDAALGQAVVTNPALPLRVRQGLNVESGLNDGGSVPFLTLFIGLAAAEEGLGGGGLRFAAEQIGYGTLIGAAAGVAGGVALRRASGRGWTVPLFEKLALAALAVIHLRRGRRGGRQRSSSRRSSAAAPPAWPPGRSPSARSTSPRRTASCSTSLSSSSSVISPRTRSATPTDRSWRTPC